MYKQECNGIAAREVTSSHHSGGVCPRSKGTSSSSHLMGQTGTLGVTLDASCDSPLLSRQLSSLAIPTPKISCRWAFPLCCYLSSGPCHFSGNVLSKAPVLIGSLQSHLPSIHPPHCCQNDLAVSLITSLQSLKPSDDSPFVRPPLIWPLVSARLNSFYSFSCTSCSSSIDALCFPPKGLSVLYLSDSSPGAPLFCSAHESTRWSAR